jgi:hypothetical protein
MRREEAGWRKYVCVAMVKNGGAYKAMGRGR